MEQLDIIREVVNAHSKDIKKLVVQLKQLTDRLVQLEQFLASRENKKVDAPDFIKNLFGGLK